MVEDDSNLGGRISPAIEVNIVPAMQPPLFDRFVFFGELNRRRKGFVNLFPDVPAIIRWESHERNDEDSLDVVGSKNFID